MKAYNYYGVVILDNHTTVMEPKWGKNARKRAQENAEAWAEKMEALGRIAFDVFVVKATSKKEVRDLYEC